MNSHWGSFIPSAPIIPVPPPAKPAPAPGKEPDPPSYQEWLKEEYRARYCGFVDSKGRVDVDGFRRAIAAPWRGL